MGIKIRQESVFDYIVDDTAIKIIKLYDNCFVWLQYGPNEGSSCDLNFVKQYTEKEIRSMVELFTSTNGIKPIELFEKYLKL